MLIPLAVPSKRVAAETPATPPISDFAGIGSSIVRKSGKSNMRWPAVVIELIATVALALSTLVAITAVSIGIARADVLGARADADAAPLAIALFIGLLLSGMGGLTALMAEDRTRRD